MITRRDRRRGNCSNFVASALAGLLLTLAATAHALVIGNGVQGDGEVRVDVDLGGETRTVFVDPFGEQGITEVMYDLFHYVDVGANGSAVRLGGTTITQQATSSGANQVTSKGQFSGANGTIDWVAVSTLFPGTSKYSTTLTFSTASPAGFGATRVIQYADIDVPPLGGNKLVRLGSFGAPAFQLVTVQDALSGNIGMRQDLPIAANAVCQGWTAAPFSGLKSQISGSGASYATNGIITGLASTTDSRFPGAPAWGPADITSAIACDLTPAAQSATVTFSISAEANVAIPTLTKAFDRDSITDGLSTPGGVARLIFAITNPAGSNPARVVGFTDTLPSKLRIAGAANVASSCTGGNITANPGSATISVSGVTVSASTTTDRICTIWVDVTNVPGQVGICPSDTGLTNAGGNITGQSNISFNGSSVCLNVLANLTVPTGCTPTISTTPTPLTSAGGSAQLDVTGCSPATGLTYRWWHNGAETNVTKQNPVDQLAPNPGPTAVVSTYQVVVCNGAACTDRIPNPPLTAVVPPPLVIPTGCVPSLNTSPSPLTSAGGTAQLNVTSCTPATGLTYNWSRNGSPGWKTTANPTDSLPPNTSASPVTTEYQVKVCNGAAACTALLPASPLVATVPTGAPTGCNAGTSTPSLPSSGGTAQLNANCASPTSGISYSWTRDSSSFATATQQNPADPLPPNAAATAKKYTYVAKACLTAAPAICTTMSSVLVTVAGTVPPPEGCAAGTSTPSLPSSGGTAQLNANCASPTSGISYSWTRDDGSFGTSTQQNPSDLLPENSTPSPKTYTYVAVACLVASPQSCTTLPAVLVTVAQLPEAGRYQGLWWRDPPGSESGWGINFAHQGDVIFATWFTYDARGQPLWLIALLDRTGPGTYAGAVFTTTGPPFNAQPFDPRLVVETQVGSMSVTFSDADYATLSYTVNLVGQSKASLTQSKPITRQRFAEPVPRCVWGAVEELTAEANFQDLWWASPPGSESGWGVNLTHQGDVIVATWFTYGAEGQPLWLIAVAEKQAEGTYSGPIWTVVGNAIDAVPWEAAKQVETEVGTLTITFAVDGDHAAFAYTVNGISQSKAIERQVFVAPGTVCH